MLKAKLTFAQNMKVTFFWVSFLRIKNHIIWMFAGWETAKLPLYGQSLILAFDRKLHNCILTFAKETHESDFDVS